MNYHLYVKENISGFPELKPAIFDKGFLLTDGDIELTNDYPYYNNWSKEKINGYTLIVHKRQKIYRYKNLLLIGHAYNPFRMLADEIEILKNIYESGFPYNVEIFAEITGIFALFCFTENKEVYSAVDFCGLRTLYSGIVNGKKYWTSHEELLANVVKLTPDEYVKRLESYKYYPLYGEALPGDITHYVEIKRVMPNNFRIMGELEERVQRFYPYKRLDALKYEDVLEQVGGLFRNSADLAAVKWNNPAISLSGGMDSKVSLAASLHCKQKYRAFTYCSCPTQKSDFYAAKKICENERIKHNLYNIPLEKENYPEYDLVKAIFSLNSRCVLYKRNFLCERLFLRKNKSFDVFITSVVSPIGRAYCYNKVHAGKFPEKPSGRYFSAFHNVFLNFKLLRETEKIFNNYITETKMVENLYNYDWTDLYFIEHYYGKLGCHVQSTENIFISDVDVFFNNRKICDLLMSLPLSDRKKDKIYKDLPVFLGMDRQNSEIVVKNPSQHTFFRMLFDKWWFKFTVNRFI